MKLVKKVLAGLCALTMAMTAAASLAITASAAELPTLYPVVTVNEEAGTASIDLKVKNIPTKIVNGGYEDPAYIFSFGCTVDVSSFATESIRDLSGRNFTTWKNEHFVNGSLGFDALVNVTPGLEGYLSYGGAFTSASAATSVGAVTGDLTVCTIKDIKLNDDALKNGFTVKCENLQIILNNEYWGTGDAFEVACIQGDGTATSESASWKPSTPPTPTVDWTTATQFGSDYHSDIDDSDAVAYTAELTGDGTEYDTVTWKVTPAEGAAKGCRASANIGGEGTYTIGLVIGDVTSDQITSVEAALGAQGNAQ